MLADREHARNADTWCGLHGWGDHPTRSHCSCEKRLVGLRIDESCPVHGPDYEHVGGGR